MSETSTCNEAAAVIAQAQDLINLRVTQAEESLAEARLLLEKQICRGATDRVYFAMFYCACALLGTREFGPSRDGNIAAKFYREFIKTGLIPMEIGLRFKRATELHQHIGLGAETPPSCERIRELFAAKLFLAKQ